MALMEETDIIVRPFDKELDFDAVMEMEVDCFPPEEAWNRRQYEKILDDPNLYFRVAYDGAVLAGSTFAFVNQGDDEDTTHLDGMVVGKAYRRRGLGRQFTLMRLDAGRRAGDRQAIVEVGVDNPASISLLQSVGFKEYGRFPGYYKGVKDALLLHMEL
jgi:ribosomal protein S18 acetylase RimI-like enzyme